MSYKLCKIKSPLNILNKCINMELQVWQQAEDTVTILEVGVTNDQQILSKFYALSDNFCQ
jgi:hypothetical protein